MREYLIVDDNGAFAENLAEILGDTGANVDVAPGGDEALRMAGRKRYDAMISDMRMPLMSGAELVHRMHRVDAELPTIVVTAYTHDDDLRAVRREGILGLLPKPVPVARLVELAQVARRGGVVVVVEDDAAFADNVCNILRLRGFSAVTAPSLLESDRLGDIKPFVALVDLRLPDAEHGEAMLKLRERFPGLPMVVMTGFSDLAPPIEPVATLEKPIAMDKLLALLERLYGERRA